MKPPQHSRFSRPNCPGVSRATADAFLNNSTPVARITHLSGLTVCQTNNGTEVVPIQWDYAAWKPMTERFITASRPPRPGIFIAAQDRASLRERPLRIPDCACLRKPFVGAAGGRAFAA